MNPPSQRNSEVASQRATGRATPALSSNSPAAPRLASTAGMCRKASNTTPAPDAVRATAPGADVASLALGDASISHNCSNAGAKPAAAASATLPPKLCPIKACGAPPKRSASRAKSAAQASTVFGGGAPLDSPWWRKSTNTKRHSGAARVNARANDHQLRRDPKMPCKTHALRGAAASPTISCANSKLTPEISTRVSPGAARGCVGGARAPQTSGTISPQ